MKDNNNNLNLNDNSVLDNDSDDFNSDYEDMLNTLY